MLFNGNSMMIQSSNESKCTRTSENGMNLQNSCHGSVKSSAQVHVGSAVLT